MGEVSFVCLFGADGEEGEKMGVLKFHSAGVWSAGLWRIFGIPDDLNRKGKNV